MLLLLGSFLVLMLVGVPVAISMAVASVLYIVLYGIAPDIIVAQRMSSVSAQRGGGIFGGPHYSAAKAGVLGLAKAMAREFGPAGIRVNSVTPGLIQTDITGGKLTDQMRVDIIKGIPLSRLGEASDVANIYLFLASDLSAYVTGAVIDVNGGMAVEWLYDQLEGRSRIAAFVIANAISVAAFLVLGYQAVVVAEIAGVEHSPVLQLPNSIGYYALAIGALLVSIVTVSATLRVLRLGWGHRTVIGSGEMPL